MFQLSKTLEEYWNTGIYAVSTCTNLLLFWLARKELPDWNIYTGYQIKILKEFYSLINKKTVDIIITNHTNWLKEICVANM